MRCKTLVFLNRFVICTPEDTTAFLCHRTRRKPRRPQVNLSLKWRSDWFLLCDLGYLEPKGTCKHLASEEQIPTRIHPELLDTIQQNFNFMSQCRALDPSPNTHNVILDTLNHSSITVTPVL